MMVRKNLVSIEGVRSLGRGVHNGQHGVVHEQHVEHIGRRHVVGVERHVRCDGRLKGWEMDGVIGNGRPAKIPITTTITTTTAAAMLTDTR